MQSVGVQPIGMKVRCGDDAHAVIEQRLEQAVQDHRVGDVGDMKLVEADQPKAFGHALAEHLERVNCAVHVGEFAVHLAHEFMKVQARLAFERHRVEKAIHQKALAAPHPTVHVDAARNFRASQQSHQRVATPSLVSRPLVFATFQRIDGSHLGSVCRVAAFGQGALVQLANRHVRLQME